MRSGLMEITVASSFLTRILATSMPSSLTSASLTPTTMGSLRMLAAGLPEVGERVSIEIKMDEKADSEQWWGLVARIPNKYANLGCNVAVNIATFGPRYEEVKSRSPGRW